MNLQRTITDNREPAATNFSTNDGRKCHLNRQPNFFVEQIDTNSNDAILAEKWRFSGESSRTISI